MSTLETILNRAMSDRAFADAIFADPDKALAEYNLPPEELAKFEAMSRAEFEALDTEERRSMSVMPRGAKTGSGKVHMSDLNINKSLDQSTTH